MSIKALMQSKLMIDDLNNDASGFQIAARQKGFMAWLANLLGVGTTNHMAADENGISFETTSFSGNERAYIPLAHVSATVYKYGSPVWMLLAAATGFATGLLQILVGLTENSRTAEELYMGGFGAAVVGLVFFVAYKMTKKTVTIGVLTDAGSADALRLEATESEVEQLLSMSKWLEATISGGEASSAPTSHNAPPPPPSFG